MGVMMGPEIFWAYGSEGVKEIGKEAMMMASQMAVDAYLEKSH